MTVSDRIQAIAGELVTASPGHSAALSAIAVEVHELEVRGRTASGLRSIGEVIEPIIERAEDELRRIGSIEGPLRPRGIR